MNQVSEEQHVDSVAPTESSPPPGKPAEDTPLSPHCPRCDYDLTGTLESGDQVCPECGRSWSVEELAVQHFVRSHSYTRTEWLLWGAAPGPAVCVTLAMGLVFGGLVWWVALLGVVGFSVLMTVEWMRGLYRRSFVRGRSPVGRFLFVAGGTLGLVVLNTVEMALVLVVAIVVRGAWAD